jgi:AcrR family transcriptional regulator
MSGRWTSAQFRVMHGNMKNGASRPYRQTARADAAEETRRNILAAAVALWRTRDLEQLTLADIAEQAGCTTQTVLRRFGSKDGVLDACLAEGASGIEALRDRAPAGDQQAALDVLLAHYEADGDDALRTLAIEDRSAMARRIAEHGRKHHRSWCARVFAPFLPAPTSKRYAVRLDAFVAATDLYLWKLLRRDLGRTAAQTREAFATILAALASSAAGDGKRR